MGDDDRKGTAMTTWKRLADEQPDDDRPVVLAYRRPGTQAVPFYEIGRMHTDRMTRYGASAIRPAEFAGWWWTELPPLPAGGE